MQEFRSLLGPLAEGVFGASQWEPDERIPYPGSRSFLHLFQKTYGVEPSYHAANAYAAVKMLEEAVTGARSLNREKIREHIVTGEHRTVVGPFKLRKDGTQIGHRSIIIQWQKRKDRILFQFLLIIASVGCVLTATIGYLISVPLVRTLAESEKLPLRLFSDEIFSFASDSFHDLLDARNEDTPSVVETSKQDGLARIAYFKPLDSANLSHFIVLDDEKRILVDTDRILQEAGMTEISEEATEGDVRLTDRNGKTLIGYLKYFPAWRWRMIAVVHEEDLKKKIIWLKILIYGAGTLGFLSLVVAFSFILKKRIQEPLTKLVSHANRLKEGRYDALPERWVGEMGELSSAFSRMADAIREREQKLFELAKFPQSNPNLLMKVSPEGKKIGRAH